MYRDAGDSYVNLLGHENCQKVKYFLNLVY